jgi:hypothetical protein
MKAYGVVDIYIHIFLTSALAGGEWSASHSGRFTPGERTPGTHLIGDWVDPGAGLDDVEKRKFLTIPVLELRPLGRPARSHSLYRLRLCTLHIRILEQCANYHPSVSSVFPRIDCMLLMEISRDSKDMLLVQRNEVDTLRW